MIDGIGSALVGTPQFVAKAPGVYSNDRIRTAVKVRPLAVQLVGENGFFERMALSGEPLFDDEGEQAPQLLRARKDFARKDSLELARTDDPQFGRSWAIVSVSIGRSVRTDRSVQRVCEHVISPFPEVEHRRDLAPTSRRASEFGRIQEDAPWLELTSACCLRRHDSARAQ